MVKEVVRSPLFIRQVKNIDGSYIIRLKKLIEKIIQSPEIGKPMKFDRKGTREVYLSPFRLSYAYDKLNDVLYLLSFYHKDEQ